MEFEVSVDLQSEEEQPSIMDEDEWTDRNNFGNSSLILEGDEDAAAAGSHDAKKAAAAGGGQKKKKSRKTTGSGRRRADDEDTSDDSVSDIDTDTDSEEDEDVDDAGSRPLTSNEARQLQKEWIKKYDPAAARGGDHVEDVSTYDNVKKKT